MFDKNRFISLPDAELLFIENFYTPSVSDAFLAKLSAKLAWKQGEITIFGKKIEEPRLTAWYGDAGKNYTYSGKLQVPLAWQNDLILIKKDIENLIKNLIKNELNNAIKN